MLKFFGEKNGIPKHNTSNKSNSHIYSVLNTTFFYTSWIILEDVQACPWAWFLQKEKKSEIIVDKTSILVLLCTKVTYQIFSLWIFFGLTRGKSFLESWVTPFLPTDNHPLSLSDLLQIYMRTSHIDRAHAQEVWNKSDKD